MLTCDNSSCGEVVAVSGRAGVEYYEHYGFDGEPEDSGFNNWLRPVNMYPAPPIFPVSKKVPHEVESELKLAFQLFWSNRSASTSRLRTCLERVLDDQGISTTKIEANGKEKRLNLFDRIKEFENQTKDPDTVESMTALRIVGNIGSHGDEVSEKDYFNLLDVFEDALDEIYEDKTAKLKAKKAALIALKK